MKTIVYNTAALFSARETLHNVMLTEILEEKYGYEVVLPQRDGFEFGRLASHLKKLLPPGTDIYAAVQRIIFLMNMGMLVPSAHCVVACLDEPVNEGTVSEMALAWSCAKHIVAWRSDSRSPYGDISGPLQGTHFFPAFLSKVMVLDKPLKCATVEEARESVSDLAKCIHEAIQQGMPFPAAAQLPEPVRRIREAAALLFANLQVGAISDDNDDGAINGATGTAAVAKRYVTFREEIESIAPKILHVNH